MSEIKKVVVFQVGSEDYAIPIENVISIEKMEGATPIPHLPEYVNGIVKVRGELIPVIDFENILYKRSLEITEQTRLIVLQTDDLALGVLVKDAKEILDIPSDALKQIGLIAYQKTNYFTGVANLDQRLITIIDPSILVQSLEGIKEIREHMQGQAQTN
ncbi:chemotaxis protein CheW [Bacillus canaveralius]|uniref:Chemotaxis protein CheW n=1 Tax=Bacillus canaveralius TaxID=1403243 RepID=A0A2N5GRG8_9BACI|nr:chemotaxis protein CheW [Bacillus canaveralius]PLR86038.1 chemotaxis protein CheW [Bacillus canaveralius]PLS00157.1 chemotaxis protein CheW [Bacillus canaveralius]